MKRFVLGILSLALVFAGSVSGAVLQSTAVAGVAAYLTDGSPAVTIGAFCATMCYAIFAPSSNNKFAMVVFTEGICDRINTSLIETSGSNAPSLQRTNTGFLEALTSAQNTAGTQQIPIDPGTGKTREVKIKYIQRGTEDDIQTDRPSGCAGQVEPSPKEQIVAITEKQYSKAMIFTRAQMRKLCEADSEYIAGVLNSRLDPFMVALNKKLITNASTNFGNWYGGSNAVKSFNMLKANDDPHYMGEAKLVQEIQRLESTAKPIVVGDGLLNNYMNEIGIGCCNSGGIGLNQAGNMNYYMDKYAGGILGNANDFIAMIPGYLQLLTYNENVGEYAEEDKQFSHGTITDPKTGLVLDMEWYYNTCDKVYTMFFGLQWEQYYLPSNAFAYGDELAGFNGLLHARAAQLP